VDVGMGPLWLPVRAHHHISSPYLQCIDPCVRSWWRSLPHHLHSMLLALMLIYILFSVLHQDSTHSAMPFAQDFRWPYITHHTQLAQRFIDMIPPTASVSAQSRLVPHVSQRLNVYMFPYAD